MRTFVTNLKPQNLISKAFFLIILFSGIFINSINSQTWCTPNITENFAQGLNNVQLNGNPVIDRTSPRSENYINTGLSTTLVRGQTYTVSLLQGFGSFCNAGNLRVWIDFNRDYDFSDPGETVMLLNSQFTAGPFQINFTVPADAYIGTTRMRATSKMMESCGHIAPSPCNVPVDPVGYHGETEDYDIIVVSPTGLTNISGTIPDKFQLYQNYPNPFNPTTSIKFDVASGSHLKLVIYDVTGSTITTLVDENLHPGTYKADWDASSYASGIYYYKITAGEFTQTARMVLVK